MDVRQMTRLLRLTAKGSLVLLGATVVLAGDRPHEQPTRPHMSASCSPNWGFNQTCWSRFPEVPSCQNSGYSYGAQGYENYPSQQMLYTTQNPMTYQNSESVSPAYGSPQRPISVFPDSAQGGIDASSNGMSPMPVEQAPNSSAPQSFGPSLPSAAPVMPGEHMRPSSPGPAAPPGLPPLPTPPGHSSWQPNMNFNQNQQPIMRPAAVSNRGLQSGSRYGIVSHSMNSSQAVPSPSVPIASESFTNTLVNNNQMTPRTTSSAITARRYASSGSAVDSQTSQIPVSFASQSRATGNPSGSATSYRSGASMPPIVNYPPTRFRLTQLPTTPDYSTIPAKPLLGTP